MQGDNPWQISTTTVRSRIDSNLISRADPPPNDNFANALVIAGSSGSVLGTNKDATKEEHEPNHPGGAGGASVWYRWTAPSNWPPNGQMTFDTIGFRNQSTSSFQYLNALMAVYTGSSLISGLTRVAASSSGNKVTFSPVAGKTYQIAIDSKPDTNDNYLPGTIPLHWGRGSVPNDDFASAQVLVATGSFDPLSGSTGSFSRLLGSNEGATKEPGEPNHRGSAGGASVWYRWTALSDGSAKFIFNPCSTCSLIAANAPRLAAPAPARP